MRRRLLKTVCSLSLTIFSTLSAQAFANSETYKVEQAAYVNSPDGAVEAACRPGDQLVKGLCFDRTDAISVPAGERMPFPALKDSETALQDAQLKVESTAQSIRCQPERLRADQRIRLMVTAVCKPSHS